MQFIALEEAEEEKRKTNSDIPDTPVIRAFPPAPHKVLKL